MTSTNPYCGPAESVNGRSGRRGAAPGIRPFRVQTGSRKIVKPWNHRGSVFGDQKIGKIQLTVELAGHPF